MKARLQGRRLRLKSGSSGRVDGEEIARLLGLRVYPWNLPHTELPEATVGNRIAVSPEVDEAERRWSIAHAIGHRIMHPGNHLWLRSRTLLATPFEREAEDFAYGLLVDEEEAMGQGLTTAGEFAEYFGVPVEMVRVQGRLC